MKHVRERDAMYQQVGQATLQATAAGRPAHDGGTARARGPASGRRTAVESHAKAKHTCTPAYRCGHNIATVTQDIVSNQSFHRGKGGQPAVRPTMHGHVPSDR